MGLVGLVGHWGHAWKGFAPCSVPPACRQAGVPCACYKLNWDLWDLWDIGDMHEKVLLLALCSLFCALCALCSFKLLWFLTLVGFFSMHNPDNSFIFAISLL
jgi:hypothetical protein